MTYKQLTQEQRRQIYACKKAGFTQNAIAEELQVHKATVSRELKRNAGQRSYRPKQAQALVTARQMQRACGTRIGSEIRDVVKAKLQKQWSPEQIAGRLQTERGVNIGHERVYQYIYDDKRKGGTLHHHLRC